MAQTSMVADQEERSRRSLRLKGFDYSQAGAYFVTLVTFQRESLFGDVLERQFVPNQAGKVVQQEWTRTAEIRPGVHLDDYVVMPNHLHAIVIFEHEARVGAHSCAPLRSAITERLYRPPRSLGSLIAGFKSSVTKRINQLRDSPGVPVWQRNYYEHVVRNESELGRIRDYIALNPERWQDDPENPRPVGQVRERERTSSTTSPKGQGSN
jgi:REP-associated tyrosine transposase